ncbi:MAG: hypothetical protein HYR97_05320 [Candidatus Melainabacteria bacterium]|nr:hypothetical protein [Candidatus Melainabacteria bacterium]
MQEQTLKHTLNKNINYSPLDLKLDFETYLRKRKINTNKKLLVEYEGIKIALTQKQIEVLTYVAKGYSNIKIAKELTAKESTMKLLIYRLIKYLESVLYERIDRFYLIIIAQKFNLDDYTKPAN